MADIVKTHNDDVIFSSESLKEFIRLIQRQGINNLTIYSVNDLLNPNSENYYTRLKTRMPPPNFSEQNCPNEFEFNEIKNRRNHFVFVRYSFCWQGGFNSAGVAWNEVNKRHIFIQTVNDVKFYKVLNNDGTINTTESSVFSQGTTTDAGVIPENRIFTENANTYNKNGVFTITIDNTQYVIKIRGFDNNGKWTGDYNPNKGAGVFLRGDGNWTNELQNSFKVRTTYPEATNTYNLGTTNIKWKNIYGSILGDSNNYFTDAYIQNLTIGTNTGGGLSANTNEKSDIGSSTVRFATIYAKDIGTSSKYTDNGYFTNIIGTDANVTNLTVNGYTVMPSRLPTTASDSSTFWRGDGIWSNTLTGSLTTAGLSSSGVVNITCNYGTGNTKPDGGVNKQALVCSGGAYFSGNIVGNKVYGAVFNDYAEYRTTIDLEPGHVVVDNDDGSLKCADYRLMPGAQVISDTFGFGIGETEETKTPLAVSGRVLVYTYQDRNKYHSGMAVCSAPGGTVDIMTREEIKEYPDCIIGIVSEIPNYEEWGTNKVKVNDRIWIKVR